MTHPTRSHFPRRALTLAGAFVLGGALGGALAPLAGAQASAQQGARPPAYEFAELAIFGNDAVLFVAGRAHYLQGPVRNEPEAVEGEPKYRLANSIPALHLTTLGRSGWDVVQTIDNPTRQVFLMRRPI